VFAEFVLAIHLLPKGALVAARYLRHPSHITNRRPNEIVRLTLKNETYLAPSSAARPPELLRPDFRGAFLPPGNFSSAIFRWSGPALHKDPSRPDHHLECGDAPSHPLNLAIDAFRSTHQALCSC
jgi:hypothetical protein